MEEKNKKKSKKWLWIFPIVILILAIVAGGFFLGYKYYDGKKEVEKPKEEVTKKEYKGTLSSNWRTYAKKLDSFDALSAYAIYTLDTKKLPEEKEYAGDTYKKLEEVDVSEEQNNEVILGYYQNQDESKTIIVIGQDGGVYAPKDSSNLFGTEGVTNEIPDGDATLLEQIVSNYKLIDLSNFDTSQVVNMKSMFAYCENLEELILKDFDTSNVTSMESMFAYCYKLKSIDLSNFNTSNVVSMRLMFYNCTSLTKIDVSSFDTSKVKDMRMMFNLCKKAKEIILSDNFGSSAEDMALLFSDCIELESLDLTGLDTRVANSIEDIDKGVTGMFSGDSKLNKVTVGCNFSTDDISRLEISKSKITKVCNQ